MQTLYRVQGHTLTLTDGNASYVLKVRDLPQEEKPREKLLAHGPEFLSTQELLAVLLGVGTRKEEVFTMSARIIKEYGSKSILAQKDALKMAEDLDIPRGKAAQIIACGELGKRFFARNEGPAPTVRSAKDVFEHTREMRHLPKEHLRGLYLNAHYKVIHDEVLSIGTLDASIIHPREVFKPALEYSAAAVILVHNHPSGRTTPSAADIRTTMQIYEAGKLLGIQLIDHVIVTKEAFSSVPLDKE